jgi:hypothetical protein
MGIGIKINMNRNLKSAVIYFFTAVFAFIFDRVYAIFSHGVFSKDMSFMWLFLLCSGILFYLVLYLICNKTKRELSRFALNIYNSGTAVFVTGMLLNGIFEIAGTGSVFILYYKIAGIIFMVIGFILLQILPKHF